VQVIGTFYDENEKVVGTDFTYTTPSSINPNDRAPFKLILSSATIPIEEIKSYKITVTSQ
jgi:hypothetical protein